MAHSVQFGAINKKVNSTKNTFTVLTTETCNLKEPCDIYNPVFTVQPLANINWSQINYMYVADFYRYYWVTEVRFVLGHWEIVGKCDVLASFKGDIGTQPFYIVRAEAAPLSAIPDPYTIIKTNPIFNRQALSAIFNTAGSYVVCCAGDTGNRFYMLPEANWRSLYAAVFSSGFMNDYYTFWDALIQDVSNVVFKPEDYVLSAIWVPAAATGAAEQIKLGYTNTGVTGYAITPGTLIWSTGAEWTIPQHPQAVAVGSYLNSSHYRTINLTLPGYGNLVLDPDIASTCPILDIDAGMDVTGTVTYSVGLCRTAGVPEWRTVVCTNLSADAGFTATRAGITNAVTSVGKGALTGGLGGAMVGAAAGFFSGMPQVERASSGGSRSVGVGGTSIVLTVGDYLVEPPHAATQGTPYCGVSTPGTLGGYMKCQDASIQCTGTQVEIEEINSFLNGGFVYE